MKGHNCSECGIKCSVSGIDEFLKEHGEVDGVVDSLGDVGQVFIDLILQERPGLLYVVPQFIQLARECMVVGYYRGRTYPEVPEVFKEE